MSSAEPKSGSGGEGVEEEEEEEEDFDDLVNAINYNTITSLAALRDILGKDSRTSADDTNWFQHYFLHHVNRLPSRSQYAGRRLSECPEEDETKADADAAPKKDDAAPDGRNSASSSSSSASSPTPPATTSQPTTPKRTASLTPPTSPRILSRGTSPHLDKRFFDTSLVEMKSQASSSSTIDYDSNDEVWVRRTDADIARRKRELGSQPLPTSAPEEPNMAEREESYRPRAGTWSISSRHHPHPPPTKQDSSREKERAKEKRRGSGDDVLANSPRRHTPTTPTPTGSTSSSNSGGLLDAFRPRSKSDASRSHRKPTTLIAQMKNAVQNSLMSPSSGSHRNSSSTSSDHHGGGSDAVGGGGGGRPRAGSDSSSGSTASRGPVSKVIDLFRHRSHSAVSAEDKRKARAAALHNQQVAAHSLGT
ncbi:hypothetical protein LSTR_LSTR002839 [Laodelphax striatellus]|uniref:Uncharacterized protein n=1 Tax=Laodelphax striatellus TaxID=195883 RepID=A0A482XHL0_LAOST|nr:hypothetical protein LSTR_LSTR002839 [Laodelphax striatellus]